MDTTLTRFVKAQENTYATALSEITRGRKQSHWMWYIFPQMKGLGLSETSRFYGIRDSLEAADYLNHPLLGKRLIEICQTLLKSADNAARIFGSPDEMKLKSSMTLFSAVENASPVFQQVLDRFFDGEKDEKTLLLLKKFPER